MNPRVSPHASTTLLVPEGARRGAVPRVDSLIKQFILANRLAPGDAMPTETVLAENLAVSRSSVREAMKTLTALDIVDVRHGHGTYVGQMSLAPMVESLAFRGALKGRKNQHVLADLVDVREMFETSYAETIMERLNETHTLTLRRIVATMREHATRGEEFRSEDREFHEILMEVTGNALVVELTGAFWEVHAIAANTLEPVRDLRDTADAHETIIDALVARDAVAAKAALSAHYAPIRARMRQDTA